MLRYLRSIRNYFRKTPASQLATPSASTAAGLPVPPPLPRGGEGVAPVARVETASLQLAAIMAKFPEEVKKLVLKLPPAEAMVALPLPTIIKFLPTGSVKMSLASVVRQAPPGTFAPLNTGDKRLVEVPLAEIFKRVNPAILKKREDQRVTDLAAEGFDIFGDEENPQLLAPRVADVAAPAVFAPRALQMPVDPLTAGPMVSENPKTRGPKTTKPKSVPKPAPVAEAPKPPIVDDQPPLIMPIKDLAGAWPEEIKSEVHGLNGTTVALPSGQISAGLAKGKVAFAWGQLRSWMTPPPAPTAVPEDTELQLPLRIVAPAFLKHSKSSQARKASSAPDASIPALFGPSAGTFPTAPVAAPAVEAEPTFEAAPAPVEEAPVAEKAAPAPVVEAPAPVTDAPAAPEPVVDEPVAADLFVKAPAEPTADIVAPAPEVSAPVAEPAVEAPAPAPAAETIVAAPAVALAAPQAQTIGELFGQAEKADWTPNEIVNGLCAQPSVAGAVVALQEGLVIAHKLPEPFKGEVFAAFLPQIFARLNQYSNEMKLGAVNELTISADGAPCHLFRRGQVFFAVLGKPEANAPLPAIRKCADALASQ